MKKILPLSLCFVCQILSYAQNEWVKGSVVLANKKVLTGELSKKPIHELILVNTQDGMKALPAHQIEFYRFYDEVENINRKFISIKLNDFFKTSKFFEIVIQGNAKVVRRYHKKSDSDQLDNARDFDYFAFIDNKLLPLSAFKNKILPLLSDRFPIEIPTFISMNNLSPQSMKDAFLIIKHFNTLTKHNESLVNVD
jgi:hypothetical protein